MVVTSHIRDIAGNSFFKYRFKRCDAIYVMFIGDKTYFRNNIHSHLYNYLYSQLYELCLLAIVTIVFNLLNDTNSVV